MQTEEEWDEAEERAERMGDLKRQLAVSLEGEGVSAYPWKTEGDIWVEGPLSVIVEWAREWRSEIDELG